MASRIIYLLFIICTLMVSSHNVNAQTVVVQNNNEKSTTSNSADPNIKYINGIPSTEDIGGVDTRVTRASDSNSDGVVFFTNYQSFTVTVYYEIIYDILYSYGGLDRKEKKIGSLVIPTGGTKTVDVRTYYRNIQEVYTITRKL